ncbi:predicted protein [Histoplasma capsulatum var. duboisii H88]|uniref:Predicted protein n=1 Tax=Ajellomyces capsulatus (strain H88) TaxID=544711 RepID=F0USK9_AJEC8|nr:predicted protein [Histoplasma capsulatum var. duboisii H88]QSS54485.1 hypothetical protein I7I53_02044 [Histoplasma capsulatum var. duboisii H88]
MSNGDLWVCVVQTKRCGLTGAGARIRQNRYFLLSAKAETASSNFMNPMDSVDSGRRLNSRRVVLIDGDDDTNHLVTTTNIDMTPAFSGEPSAACWRPRFPRF